MKITRAGAFNPNVPTTVHRMTAGQISVLPTINNGIRAIPYCSRMTIAV
ncbi:hypothetical protein [Providencia sp. PROV278]|nr:hypothetical protein [Providencia sp. PROV278]